MSTTTDVRVSSNKETELLEIQSQMGMPVKQDSKPHISEVKLNNSSTNPDKIKNFVEKYKDPEEEDSKKAWKLKELGESLSGVIFLIKNKIKFYDESDECFYESTEFKRFSDEITLFKFANKERKVVMKGNYYQILDAHGETKISKFDGQPYKSIKSETILYTDIEPSQDTPKVVRLVLSSASMKNWKSYLESFSKSLILSYITEFSSEIGKKGKNVFSFVKFTKGEEVDTQKYITMMKDTEDYIEVLRNKYKDDELKKEPKEDDDEKKQVIDVNDLPF